MTDFAQQRSAEELGLITPDEQCWLFGIFDLFNRFVRYELLYQRMFAGFDDVHDVIHGWLAEYNEKCPHDELGDLKPKEACLQLSGNSIYELSP